MDEDRVKECYQALVDNMAFFVIGDENGSYLADTQQLYNFEILNNSRVRERERKAKSRAKAAAEKTNKEQDISSGSVFVYALTGIQSYTFDYTSFEIFFLLLLVFLCNVFQTVCSFLFHILHLA